MWESQRAYVPKPYAGRVILYEAEVQPLFHLLRLSDAWAKIARHIETVRLPGGHGSIFRGPGVIALATHLRTRLAEVRQALETTRLSALSDLPEAVSFEMPAHRNCVWEISGSTSRTCPGA